MKVRRTSQNSPSTHSGEYRVEATTQIRGYQRLLLCDHARTPPSVTAPAPLRTCLRYEFVERAGGRAVSPQRLQDPLAIICRDLVRRHVGIGQYLDQLRARGGQLRRFDLEHPP